MLFSILCCTLTIEHDMVLLLWCNSSASCYYLLPVKTYSPLLNFYPSEWIHLQVYKGKKGLGRINELYILSIAFLWDQNLFYLKELIQYLKYTCPAHLYATSISPPAAEQIISAIKVILGEDGSSRGLKWSFALSSLFRLLMCELWEDPCLWLCSSQS